MSSSIDVGLNYRESNKIIQKECEKSSDGKHPVETPESELCQDQQRTV